MSSKPPEWKAPSSAEEEKQRFDSMMADFLKEDDPPKGTQQQPPSNPPPSQPSGNGGGGLSLNDVARLLDERDTRATNDARHKDLDERLKKIETAPERKKKPWWSPLH